MSSSSRFVANFQDLDVWKKAFEVSVQIHRASLDFPQIEQYALGDQIRRASKSICANIAEGFPKQSHSKLEFRRYLQISLGSANEMLTWVLYCKELGYIDHSVADGWYDEYLSICKMLNVMSQKLNDG